MKCQIKQSVNCHQTRWVPEIQQYTLKFTTPYHLVRTLVKIYFRFITLYKTTNVLKCRFIMLVVIQRINRKQQGL